MSTAPEQWLPPLPVTNAEEMAREIYAACVSEELRAAGGSTDAGQLDAVYLEGLRDFARRAARIYFKGSP